MSARPRLAFYDLDGTLVSTNVVSQYLYYLRRLPAGESVLRHARLLVLVPWLGWLELRSRRKFNIAFYRLYRGLPRQWLEAEAPGLFDSVLRPALYAGAEQMVKRDREQGYVTVLLTGSLDFAVRPLAKYLGFQEIVANQLVFVDGVATGEVAEPIVAGEEKVRLMRQLLDRYGADPAEARAYSDSWSDRPMLEAVGQPVVVNPGPRLRRWARLHRWPVVDLAR